MDKLEILIQNLCKVKLSEKIDELLKELRRYNFNSKDEMLNSCISKSIEFHKFIPYCVYDTLIQFTINPNLMLESGSVLNLTAFKISDTILEEKSNLKLGLINFATSYLSNHTSPQLPSSFLSVLEMHASQYLGSLRDSTQVD